MSGGGTTATASVSGATECTLSSNKAVAGLPATFSCESGSVSRALTMPPNTGRKPLKYKLSLLALGAGGKAKAKIAVTVSPMRKATQVSDGGQHACAVLPSRHLDCWGHNAHGQLGDGTVDTEWPYGSDTPVEVGGISGASQVSAGASHTCTLLSSGRVDCWGENEYGQLGNATTEGSDTPVEVQGLSKAAQISAGGRHTCALLSSHHVDCWGTNEWGQLGNGSTSMTQDTPVEVQAISSATQVSAGGEDTCALLSSGHIDCWGSNFYGQLGDGAEGNSHTPVEVQGKSNATQVTAGYDHTCALLSGGHIECWLKNRSGQLGNGTVAKRQTTPVEPQGISDAAEVSAGFIHACALLSTGHVECWGLNNSGQLGNATVSELQDTPVEAQGISDATQISDGGRHTCALRSGGAVDCWGSRFFGQLGNGPGGYSETPVQVHGL